MGVTLEMPLGPQTFLGAFFGGGLQTTIRASDQKRLLWPLPVVESTERGFEGQFAKLLVRTYLSFVIERRDAKNGIGTYKNGVTKNTEPVFYIAIHLL